jgi:hypothetical protein
MKNTILTTLLLLALDSTSSQTQEGIGLATGDSRGSGGMVNQARSTIASPVRAKLSGVDF